MEYESFRQEFEAIIKEGKLESYIAERVSGRKENPRLERRFGGEAPEQILWHFGKDHPEVYATARNMLRKIGEDNKKAQDEEYCWGLSFLLAGHDKEASDIAINILLGKGDLKYPSLLFADRTELGLLRLAVYCDYNGFSKEKRDQATKLFSKYIETNSEFSDMATAALENLKSKSVTSSPN